MCCDYMYARIPHSHTHSPILHILSHTLASSTKMSAYAAWRIFFIKKRQIFIKKRHTYRHTYFKLWANTVWLQTPCWFFTHINTHQYYTGCQHMRAFGVWTTRVPLHSPWHIPFHSAYMDILSLHIIIHIIIVVMILIMIMIMIMIIMMIISTTLTITSKHHPMLQSSIARYTGSATFSFSIYVNSTHTRTHAHIHTHMHTTNKQVSICAAGKG